ncbi:MAG: fasciclin domain-containing protein [Candidatus Hermodarchaeota archaeon]
MDKIIDILKQDTTLYTFVQMLKLTGVFEELSGKGPFTIFVPNNDAFGKIPSERLTEIMDDTEFMRDVIHYHIVQGEHDSKILSLEKNLTTLLGPDLDIKSNEDIIINKAKVVTADIFTSNGIIHIIDRVIKPPEIIATT